MVSVVEFTEETNTLINFLLRPVQVEKQVFYLVIMPLINL